MDFLNDFGSKDAINSLSLFLQLAEVLILAFGAYGIFYQIRHMRRERNKMIEESKQLRWEALQWAVELIEQDDTEKMFENENLAKPILHRWNLVAKASDDDDGIVDREILFQLVGDIFATVHGKYMAEKNATLPCFIVGLLDDPNKLPLRRLIESAHATYWNQ